MRLTIFAPILALALAYQCLAAPLKPVEVAKREPEAGKSDTPFDNKTWFKREADADTEDVDALFSIWTWEGCGGPTGQTC
ncbi:hypothetical protein VNI00_015378 [Paramarasmius palmivorus]|uniref:Uncharacterized protein n=1 Tax=Paramarasmius palmivorus TaxID=297713 RepID=A0AAW0BN56_9AGAR